MTIRTDVELKLRNTGIRVVPPDTTYFGPTLVVTIAGRCYWNAFSNFLEIGVRQLVQLFGPGFRRRTRYMHGLIRGPGALGAELRVITRELLTQGTGFAMGWTPS